MYLSRVSLNAQRSDTMQALASPQLMHRAVEGCFDSERQRRLWRVDWLGDACYLLILSPEQPDFTHIVKHFGYPDSEQPFQIKDYDPLLARLQTGQVWRFRLRANPVHSSCTEKDKNSGRGKVFAHVTQEQQRKWLLERAERYGFALDKNAFDVVHTRWLTFRKGRGSGHKVTLRTATFEGVLTVTDHELFRQTLLSGIGRAKAYGCGMITIARYHETENG
jgi:CRISPR system Cascade subunit CasE